MVDVKENPRFNGSDPRGKALNTSGTRVMLMRYLASAGSIIFQTHRQKGKFTTAVCHLSGLELSKICAAAVQISINVIMKTVLGSHVIANPESLRFSFLLTLVKLLQIYPKESTMKEKSYTRIC